MKSSIAMIAGLLLVASASYAGVAINGTTITFDDGTMQSTAQVEGPQGDAPGSKYPLRSVSIEVRLFPFLPGFAKTVLANFSGCI